MQPAARGRQVEPHALFPIGHGDLATFCHVARRVEFRAEQIANVPHQPRPVLGVLCADPIAEIAQHLRGPALADPYVDGAPVEARLGGRQPRHRRQKGDLDVPGFVGHGHAVHGLPGCAVGQPERPAIERFLVTIVEFEPASPSVPSGYAFDDDFDTHVADVLTAGDFPYVPDVEFPPQQVGARHRHGDEVVAVDRDARALFGRLLSGAFFVPAFEPHVPQRQRLQRGGLARVVRANEHHGVAELDLDVPKPLEIPNREVGQHGGASLLCGGVRSRARLILGTRRREDPNRTGKRGAPTRPRRGGGPGSGARGCARSGRSAAWRQAPRR